MILEAFIYLIYGLVWTLTRVFTLADNVTQDTFFVSAFDWANGQLAPISHIFPTWVIVIIFGVWVSFELAYILWKGVNWLIRKIPTIS